MELDAQEVLEMDPLVIGLVFFILLPLSEVAVKADVAWSSWLHVCCVVWLSKTRDILFFFGQCVNMVLSRNCGSVVVEL